MVARIQSTQPEVPSYGRLTVDQDAVMLAVAARSQALRVLPAKAIKVTRAGDAANQLLIDDVPISVGSFGTVCDFLDVPASFLRRAPLKVASAVVNGMMGEAKVADRELVFNGATNTVVGHRPKGQELVPATRVFEKLFASLPATDEIHYHETDRAVEASIVCRSLDIEPKKGDVVRGGLSCLYSEVDAKRASIRAYSERLVCTNGMTHREFDHEFGIPDSLATFLEEIGVTVRACLDYVSTALAPRMRRATEFEVDGPQAIRRIFRQSRLSPKYMDAVLAAYALENDGTAFGVLQAFTRAANSLRHDVRVRLQALAGDELVVIEKAHCPACYAPL